MRPKGSKLELEARRRHAVGLLQEGLTVRQVADRVGVSPGSVVRWHQMYRASGEEGLKAKRHPGGKSRLSDQQREELVELLKQGPKAHGFPTDLWTCRRVTELIEKQFAVRYDPSQVWRILRSLGWSCQKPERRARERDEQAIAAWREERWGHIKKRPKKRP